MIYQTKKGLATSRPLFKRISYQEKIWVKNLRKKILREKGDEITQFDGIRLSAHLYT
jgi:hypothetical protein